MGGPDVQTWAGIQEYRSHGAVNHGLQFSWEGSILRWLVFVNLGREDFPVPSCVVYFIPGGQLPIHVNGVFYIWHPTPAAVCFLQTVMSSIISAMKRALPPWPAWVSVGFLLKNWLIDVVVCWLDGNGWEKSPLAYSCKHSGGPAGCVKDRKYRVCPCYCWLLENGSAWWVWLVVWRIDATFRLH